MQGPEGEGRTWGEPEALLVFDVKPHEDYYVKRATIVFGFVGGRPGRLLQEHVELKDPLATAVPFYWHPIARAYPLTVTGVSAASDKIPSISRSIRSRPVPASPDTNTARA